MLMTIQGEQGVSCRAASEDRVFLLLRLVCLIYVTLQLDVETFFSWTHTVFVPSGSRGGISSTLGQARFNIGPFIFL